MKPLKQRGQDRDKGRKKNNPEADRDREDEKQIRGREKGKFF